MVQDMHSARQILTWSLCAAPVALLLHYAAGAQTSATRYQCDDGGFSLVPPPAWKRTAEVPRGYAAFLAPQQDGFVSNLVAYREPAGHKTLDDVVKSTRSPFRTSAVCGWYLFRGCVSAGRRRLYSVRR